MIGGMTANLLVALTIVIVNVLYLILFFRRHLMWLQKQNKKWVCYMYTHNTHYATFRVRFNVSFLDPKFHSAYCFSRLISVSCYSFSVSSTFAAHYNYSSRNRLLEDIRLAIVDSVLDDDKTVSDFCFVSEQLDYSFRSKDLFSGLMFRGTTKLTFDHLRYFGDRDKPASSVPAEVCAVVRFSVFHIDTKGV